MPLVVRMCPRISPFSPSRPMMRLTNEALILPLELQQASTGYSVQFLSKLSQWTPFVLLICLRWNWQTGFQYSPAVICGLYVLPAARKNGLTWVPTLYLVIFTSGQLFLGSILTQVWLWRPHFWFSKGFQNYIYIGTYFYYLLLSTSFEDEYVC